MPKAHARPEQTAIPQIYTVATRGADALGCAHFYIKSLGAIVHALGREIEAQKPDQFALKDLIALVDYLAEDWSNATDCEASAMSAIAQEVRHG